MFNTARACALYHQTSRLYADFSKSVMIGRLSFLRSSYCCSVTQDSGSRSGARRRMSPLTSQRHGCITTFMLLLESRTFPHRHSVMQPPK